MKFQLIRSIFTIMAATVVATTFALTAGVPEASAAKKVKWKVPVAFNSTLPGLGTPIVYASNNIRIASAGNIDFKIYEPNKLLPPFEILDAVSSGKVKAGYTWVGYDQGKISSLPLFAAVPFGLEPWEYTAWSIHGGGAEMLNEVYANAGKNIHAINCGIMGPETAGWFKKPIKSLNDFKGLKIRFAGLGGKVMAKLGASVTMLPGGELYSALEKGIIDATEFSMPKIDQLLGFHKIVKYNLFPGWHQSFTAMHLLINKKAWGKLDDSQKALIQMGCTAATLWGMAEGEYAQGDVIANFPNQGVTAQKLPLPVLRKLKKITNDVLMEEAAKNADFKRVWESQKAFTKNYKLWKELGYLPRDFE